MTTRHAATAALMLSLACAASAQMDFGFGGQLQTQTWDNLREIQQEGRRDPPTSTPGQADVTRCMVRDRERLRPEYERRLSTSGRDAANQWLRQQAAASGRSARARINGGKPC